MGGLNIIGASLQEVIDLVGESPVDDPQFFEIDDEEQMVIDLDEAGLQIWSCMGVIRSVGCGFDCDNPPSWVDSTGR